MSEYLSNRQRKLNVGISSYTENQLVLDVIGNTNVSGGVSASSLAVSGDSYISGRLGVGTETPSSKLTVIGDGFFTGTIFANNFIGNIIASYASSSGVSTVSQGLTGTPNIEVGIVTATEYFGVFNGTIGADVTLDYANNAGIATYANFSGIATYANFAGISTYAQVSGISTVSQGLTGTPNLVVGIVTANEYYGTFKGTIDTDVTLQYAETLGIATYATRSGIATYSNFSGIATYAQVSGISTVAEGLIGTPNIEVGIVTATEYFGIFRGTIDADVPLNYAKVAGIATYAETAGISTVSEGLTGTPNIEVGIVTATEYFGVFKGTLDDNVILQYAETAGIATYAVNSGIATYANFSVIATYAQVSGISTVAEGLTGTPNLVVGIVTATEYFGVFNGTIDANVTLEYAESAGIATYANFSGIATYSNNAGIATNVIGGIGSLSALSVSGISTLTTLQSSNATIQNLTGTGATFANLNSTGIATFNRLNSSSVFVTGITTSSGGFVGNLTGTATTATNVIGGIGSLSSLSVSGITTLSNVEIENLETQNISNSGIITTSNLNVLSGFDVFANSSVFHENVVIQGNLTVNGTEVILNVEEKYIKDEQIVLGFSTTNNESDISANGGGIAIASTEGNPLVSLQRTGINTLPETYKQLIWTSANTFGVGTTDAFLFNYAVGIGSTLVPNGVRLAVGGVQITDNTVNTSFIVGTAATFTKLNVTDLIGSSGSFSGIVTASSGFVGNLTGTATTATNVIGGIASVNSLNVSGISTVGALTGSNAFFSGIVTATAFVGDASGISNVGFASVSGYAPIAGFATYAASSGVSTSVIGGDASVNQLNVSGVSTLGVTSTTNLTTQQFNVSGLSTFSGITTYTSSLFGTQASFTGVVTASSFNGNASSATYATSAGIATYADKSGVSTSVVGGIGSISQLQVTGISTFTNGPVLIGTGTSTGTATQRLQVTGGAYVSGNLGIGTTNPTRNLDINGDVRIRGALYDTNNQSGGVNQVLISTGTGVDWGDITSSGALTAIGIAEEGTPIGNVTSIDFVGPTVTATAVGSQATVTILDFVSNAGYSTLSGVSTSVVGGIASVSQLQVTGVSTITSNSTLDALRINQLGSGNALVVEDETSPDSTPFVVSSTGSVGIGTTNPTRNLDINGGIRLRGALYDKDNQPGIANQVLLSTGTGVDWGDITSSGAITAIGIEEEGAPIGNVTSINFVGPNITATVVGAAATITVLDFVGYASTAGIATYANIAGISTNVIGGIASVTSLNVTGVSTLGVTTTTNLTAQNLNVSGVTTSTGGFVGNLTGTATTATNLSDAANITAGIINSSRLSGFYNINVSYANTSGISTVAQGLTGTPDITVGIATASSFVGNLTGTATTANNLSDAANITTGTINPSRLSGFYNINVSYANTAGISTVAQGLTGTPDITVGVVTASSFVGNLTGTATTATNLSDAANITTGTINSSRLSGFYNINVSYANTAGISTLSQGLTGTPDITVGIVTASSGNFSGIVTSSGLNVSGVTTTSVLNVGSGGTIITTTSNGYVGIGTTNPTTDLDIGGGLRLRGALYDTNNQTGTLNQVLLSTVNGVDWGDITSSGALTGIVIKDEGTTIGNVTSIDFVGPNVAATVIGAAATVTILDFVSNAGYSTLSGVSTSVIGGIASVTSLNVTGVTTLGVTTVTNLTSQNISVSGITTSTGGFVGNLTGTATTATNLSDAANITTGTIDSARLSGFYNINVSYANVSGIATYANNAGISTNVIGGIASVIDLNVTGVSTLGTTNATNLTAQSLNVSGVTTSSGGFVGNLSGTATTATNLSNAANITTGTIDSARLSGFYNINVSYANTSGISTVAQGLTGTPDITVGVVTASNFVGSGQSLTDVRIGISSNNTSIGFAGTINFTGSGISTITISSGIATINIPGSSRTLNTYIATEGQTTFSSNYSIGYVDVFLNGVKLSTTQYTATNGTSISLIEGASLSDVVEIVGYNLILSSQSSSIGIATIGGIVGTGVTLLDFRGAGISTVTVSSGIGTINITGGSSTPDISPIMMGMIF